MNKYEARWQNALKHAKRINQYINDGYVVCFHEAFYGIDHNPCYAMEILRKPLTITENSIKMDVDTIYYYDGKTGDPFFESKKNTDEFFKQFRAFKEVKMKNRPESTSNKKD